MNILSIPQELIKEKELVLISRRTLEDLLRRVIPSVRLTVLQKKALVRARKNRSAGAYLSLNEIKAKLGLTS